MSDNTRKKLESLHACPFTYESARAQGWSIPKAIERAKLRKAAWDKKDFVSYKMPSTITYNPATATGGRWIENASDSLRLVGFADKIKNNIKHKGWFIDPFQDEVYRGIVYRLPARNGKAQFVGGYADPWNEDCAFLDFSELFDDETDAARRADSIAEGYATEAREESVKDTAEQECESLKEEIHDSRLSIIQICSESRKARKEIPNACSFTIIRQALRNQVNELLQSMAKKRKRIKRLTDSPWIVCE